MCALRFQNVPDLSSQVGIQKEMSTQQKSRGGGGAISIRSRVEVSEVKIQFTIVSVGDKINLGSSLNFSYKMQGKFFKDIFMTKIVPSNMVVIIGLMACNEILNKYMNHTNTTMTTVECPKYI